MSPRESALHELPQECKGVQTGGEALQPHQPKSNNAAASHPRRQHASTCQIPAAATHPVRAPDRPPSNPAKPHAPSKIHPTRRASQTPATSAPAPRRYAQPCAPQAQMPPAPPRQLRSRSRQLLPYVILYIQRRIHRSILVRLPQFSFSLPISD